MSDRIITLTSVLFGVAMAINGTFMTFDPHAWYTTVPGVEERGPFHQHFIRDIGITYLVLGTAVLIGAARKQHRMVLWLVSTLWLAGHGLFHLWEATTGITGRHELTEELSGVFLPVLLGTALVIAEYRRNRRLLRDSPGPST